MADQITREEKIERAIDKGITGELQVYSAGGVTNIAPRNFTELLEFSKAMATAGVVVRAAFRNNPGACLALSMQALRWGMDPFAVSNKAYLVKNKSGEDQIAYESQLIHAVVNNLAPLQRRLEVTYTGTGTAMKCKVVGYLKNEGNRTFEYESPPVANIKVQNSPLWTADISQQLHYYSVRAWARRHVPEVLLGVYSDDDLEMMDANRNAQGPEHAKDITPARPAKGDPEEAERIRKEIEDDLPKEFDLVDELGEVIAEGVGPRLFLKLINEQIRTFKVGKYFEKFVANNVEMIALIPEIPFAEKVDALRQDIESIRKSLTPHSTAHDEATSEAAEGVGSSPPSADAQPSQKTVETASADAPEPEGEGPTPPDGPEAEDRASGAKTGPSEQEVQGVQASQTSAPQKAEPPSELSWWTSDGKRKYFGNPAAWSEAIIKGAAKATKADIDKVLKTNAATLDQVLACGGDWQTEAEAVKTALDKRLKELAAKP